MKKIIILLVVLATSIGAGLKVNAHAIWIESHQKASKNKAHEVKICYGEYPEGERDSVSKWYSDLKDLEVWVISPSQKKTKLNLQNAVTHLSSSFIPDEDGIYYISTTHVAKELGGTTKYEFSSVLPVVSGNISVGTAASPAMALSVIAAPKSYRSNQPIELLVKMDGEVHKKGEVSIMSPEGWVKTLHTDDSGKVVFTPNLKGLYVIEATDYKKEAGQWHDKSFTHAWKGSTTSFIVN
jgi:uncharacterized GH25 family protein